ncbi:PQQ-binding-like beta-propeller repeat protein [Fuerstiella marisgermanici]|nr:PQQ-binding-like beta-propeller repeat protein [Fuerstiella marisgermanici]
MRNLLLFTTLIASHAFVAKADDWPQWGGPMHDIVWRENGIVDKLPTDGLLPRVWSVPVGEGYSGPAVADGRVYLTDRIHADGTERVLCVDAETGKEIWKHEYPVRYTVSYPAGPRATPVINDGRVYTIGAEGHMFCFDAKTGDVIWKKEFQKDFGTKLPNWGMAAAPLVDGEKLITLVGGADGALVVAFDKATGKELWRSLDDPAIGYAPPVIYEFGGRRQLIMWHPAAVSALDPETGEVIWEHPWQIRFGLTIPMPRQIDDRLFLTAFYDGPLMLKVSADNAEVVWKGQGKDEQNTDGIHAIMPTPWITEANIFGICSYGQLRGLDTDTGKRLWETFDATGRGRWWNAFIIPHEDRFFLHNEQGDLIIADLTAEGYKEISRAKLVEPTRKVQRRMTIWSHPAFAMKSVFARNDKELVRVSLAK